MPSSPRRSDQPPPRLDETGALAEFARWYCRARSSLLGGPGRSRHSISTVRSLVQTVGLALSSDTVFRNRHRTASPGVVPLGGLHPERKEALALTAKKAIVGEKRDRPQSVPLSRLLGYTPGDYTFATSPHRMSPFPHSERSVRFPQNAREV